VFLREVRRATKTNEPTAGALAKELSSIHLFGPTRMKAGTDPSRAAHWGAHGPTVRLIIARARHADEGRRHRAEVAVKLLVLDNFDLAFRIIQEYRLPTVDVFQGAMRTLGRAKQITRIGELLRNIKVHDDMESVAGLHSLLMPFVWFVALVVPGHPASGRLR